MERTQLPRSVSGSEGAVAAVGRDSVLMQALCYGRTSRCSQTPVSGSNFRWPSGRKRCLA
jgi:hypothetical protein